MSVQLATVITGASSGIGAALAPLFAREPSRTLVLVARRTEPMEALARDLRTRFGTEVRVIAADLGQPGAAAALVAAIEAQDLSVDTLVNNAGFGLSGSFMSLPLERQSAMLQLNNIALLELTYAVLPAMRARRRGRLMNIASIAAFQPCPNFAAYGASKAFVLSFTEALAIELENTGIVVTAVCPGSTRTGFHHVAGSDNALAARLMNSPETVASEAFAALQKGQRVIVTGLVNKPLKLLNKLLPRDWTARMTGVLMKPD